MQVICVGYRDSVQLQTKKGRMAGKRGCFYGCTVPSNKTQDSYEIENRSLLLWLLLLFNI